MDASKLPGVTIDDDFVVLTPEDVTYFLSSYSEFNNANGGTWYTEIIGQRSWKRTKDRF